jgi:hypothetical protein
MKLEMPGAVKDVDFADFHFENHGWNYEVAKDISAVLLSFVDLDKVENDGERQGACPPEGSKLNCSVKAGGCGVGRLQISAGLKV